MWVTLLVGLFVLSASQSLQFSHLGVGQEKQALGSSLSYDYLFNVLVAGAPGDITGDDFGAVYIYQRTSDGFNLQANLTAPWYNSTTRSLWVGKKWALPRFGYGVSIYGDIGLSIYGLGGSVVAVTAPGINSTEQTASYATVYFIRNNGDLHWQYDGAPFTALPDPEKLPFGRAIQMWDQLSFFISAGDTFHYYRFEFPVWTFKFSKNSNCGLIHSFAAIRVDPHQGIWVGGADCVELWTWTTAAYTDLNPGETVGGNNSGISFYPDESFLHVAARPTPSSLQHVVFDTPPSGPPETIAFGTVATGDETSVGVARFYGYKLHHFLGEPDYMSARGRIHSRNNATGTVRQEAPLGLLEGTKFGWSIVPTQNRLLPTTGFELIVSGPGFQNGAGGLWFVNIATIGIDELLTGIQTLLNGTLGQGLSYNITDQILKIFSNNTVQDLSLQNGTVQLESGSTLNVLGSINASNSTIIASSNSTVSVSGCADFSSSGLVMDANSSFTVSGNCVRPFNTINLTTNLASCQQFDPQQQVGAGSLVVVANVYDEGCYNTQTPPPSSPSGSGFTPFAPFAPFAPDSPNLPPPPPPGEPEEASGGFPIWAVVIVVVIPCALVIIVVMVIFLVPSVKDVVFPYATVDNEV